MNSLIKPASITAAIFTGLVMTVSLTASETPTVSLGGSEITLTDIVNADHKRIRAEDYGLTEADVDAYYTIMEGPYGRWYRDLDPTWVLGFASETDSERQRFAEIVVQMEHARVERELAFQRAYDAIWQERRATYPLIDPARWSGLQEMRALIDGNGTRSVSAIRGDATNQRLAVYVHSDCAACDVTPVLKEAGDRVVDIFVAGVSTDDEIRTWAEKQKIDPMHVQKRKITLNHEDGEFTEHIETGETFAVFEIDGQITRRWRGNEQ